MKFFVDTAEIDAIAELNDLGMVDGVTTNPSLILKSGRNILEVTKEICDLVDGPVSAEVVALEADAMIAEGRKLAEIADNTPGPIAELQAEVRRLKGQCNYMEQRIHFLQHRLVEAKAERTATIVDGALELDALPS